ncbi:hypothetical protein DEO72_LG6g588 [Vigna unguiculata]|uniref:Uncharacterized protein n=1 Tax=Vigna unguiculata TaxID=3917 RepID=A0A4D6M5X6_VIGUN|nr:hypothetical protein DEO72_LG6g588 [Vigna unguiculata]
MAPTTLIMCLVLLRLSPSYSLICVSADSLLKFIAEIDSSKLFIFALNQYCDWNV